MSPPYDEGRPGGGGLSVEQRNNSTASLSRQEATEPRRTRRDLWVRQVAKTPAITEAERVLCLYLAVDMDDDGIVKIPQRDLAKDLGISRWRLSDRLEQVAEALWLTEVRPGSGRRPGTWQATIGVNLKRSRRPSRLGTLPRSGPDARTTTSPAEPADDEHQPRSGLDARTTTGGAVEVCGPDARTTTDAQRSGRADHYLVEEQGERSEHLALDRSAADEAATPALATAVTTGPEKTATRGKGSRTIPVLSWPLRSRTRARRTTRAAPSASGTSGRSTCSGRCTTARPRDAHQRPRSRDLRRDQRRPPGDRRRLRPSGLGRPPHPPPCAAARSSPGPTARRLPAPGDAMTAVVLAEGWSLWCESGTRLLCPGEPLDHLDDQAQAEMVRQGRARRVHLDIDHVVDPYLQRTNP